MTDQVLSVSTDSCAHSEVEVALLDPDGCIESVNQAWAEFARVNGAAPGTTGAGVSYLAVCDAAQDDPMSRLAAEEIRAALAGGLPAPVTMHIPCAAPGTSGWFDMLVSSRFDGRGRCVGATVTFSEREPPMDPPLPCTFTRPVTHESTESRMTHPEDPESSLPRLETASSGLGARPSDYATLTFPDVPRMQLEETLTQLTARAQDVLTAQGRLRALLRANAEVAGELNLQVVLRHLVVAARDLVGARYAALGVLGPDGSLEELVHTGMDEETVEEIDRLPRGRGILGVLVDHPDPVRLRDLNTHPAAVGFPEGHPPMKGFLGVPIRVRDQVFGNLYLTESTKGEFTAEDEQLVTSLAGTAGVAIENARLYEDSERRRRWQIVSTEATQQLFTSSDDRPLEVVLRYAMEGAEGDFAVLSHVQDDHVAVEASVGDLTEQIAGQRRRLTQLVIEPVVESGKPVLIPDYDQHHPTSADLPQRIGSIIAAPLLNDQRVVAAVLVGRMAGGKPFDETDLDQLAGFTGHAGVALELDQSRSDREALGLLREHERIAADLHDHVIQELFALAMGLQSMVGGLDRPEQQTRVLGYVDALDDTIRRVRATIFQLNHKRSSASLKHRLLAVLEQERPALGFAANVEFSGPLEHTVPTHMAEDVVAVVREAVSNTARHAAARSVRVRVAVAKGLLSIEVRDDGCGIGENTRSSGLTNLRRRAERYGGGLELSTPQDGGTDLRWTGRVAP
jgi:signal transduction histidine kinase